MAANLLLLNAAFKIKVDALIVNCQARGIVMRPYEGLRDPFSQAKIWRQSRSLEQIKAQINDLRSKQADFLAHCIDSVGPQQGNPVTNAIPGLSWHQWGEAVDCFWLVNGEAEWSVRRVVNGLNGYKVYAEEASRLGLDAGGLWSSLKDWPHVQLQKFGSPIRIKTLVEIDRIMKERFS